ncbi:MAG: hypothetical protein Q8P67_04610 [archaeon]|nr:hypothetical protein [archaeon]
MVICLTESVTVPALHSSSALQQSQRDTAATTTKAAALHFLNPLVDEQPATWDFGYAPLLLAQSNFVPVVLDAFVYLPGGLASSDGEFSFSATQQRYSPKDDAWETLPSFPGRVVSSFTVAPSPNASSPALYYFQYDSIWRYDIPSGRWSLSSWGGVSPLIGSAAVTSGSLIYLLGGGSATTGLANLSSFVSYDPVQGSFSRLASLPVGRLALQACVSGNRIYAVSGLAQDPLQPSGYSFYPYVDWYDLKAGSWNTSSGPARPFYPGDSGLGAQGVACTGDLVYVFYGESLVQSYDPSADQWQIVPSQPSYQDIGVGFGVTTFGQDIYLFGGFSAIDVKFLTNTIRFVPPS